MADPDPPTRKIFKPKHVLPPVESYRQEQSAEFWKAFPRRTDLVGKSSICADKLEALAKRVGCSDPGRLAAVLKDLREGANIGCRGRFREQSFSDNAPSAFEFAAEITDSVCDWIEQGFAAGPFNPADRPAGVKVNGMMCRQKPNGSARIILNLSAPVGISVNDGIDSEDFPTIMSSTAQWLAILDRAGRNCLISKCDWASAYKHIAVCPEDVCLQWFHWLGMDFAELMLVFGCRASAGLFDRLAKTVLDLVLRAAKLDGSMVIQYLDDICAACPADSDALDILELTFRQVAAEVGVKLAPTSDPDKAFSPCTKGVILGVIYDTVAWTWAIPKEKLDRLVLQIRAALSADRLRQHEMWSLAGRILHYAALIPLGRVNLVHIIRASGLSTDRNSWVPISVPLADQLHFWLIALRASSGCIPIPRPPQFPVWTREFFTDAAGGSSVSPGHGSGGVSIGFWYILPWGRVINSGLRAADGKRISRKLSALELVGPLVCVAAGAQLCRGQPVRVWVDNSGSISIYKKGYSTSCALSSTLARAMTVVAAGIGCKLTVDKITRCSTQGAVLADELSKGRFQAFRRKVGTGWDLPADPARIPPSLLYWINRPTDDPLLGQRILGDLGVPCSWAAFLASA